MKAIKLSDTHYIVVDDSEIEDGICVRYILDVPYIMFYDKGVEYKQFKITHSTQPLEDVGLGRLDLRFNKIFALDLSEVEEAIYGYSVEKMARQNTARLSYGGQNASRDAECFIWTKGFKAHQELVKNKLFTIEQTKKYHNIMCLYGNLKGEEYLQSLLPKTEWNIEFDEQGKIKLI